MADPSDATEQAEHPVEPPAGARLRRWTMAAVGLALAVSGTLLVARPLTSLVLLGIYVGTACVVAGVTEILATRDTRWWHRSVAVVWAAIGAGILLRPEASLTLLPAAITVVLCLGGLTDVVTATRTRPGSERALSATWGVAQILLGLLASIWPDVTLVLAGVWFAARMAIFGVMLLGHARRGATATGSPQQRRTWAHGRRDSLRWVATVSIAVGTAVVVVISASVRQQTPQLDAFYETPAAVPDEPGQLLRSDSYLGEQPEGGRVRRILYTTTDATGAPATASALVIVPDRAADGPRPVIAWNHGTTGIARHCAPSLLDTAATPDAIPGVEDALASGWVIVATDYTGQGTPGTFPYLIGAGQAHSTLDGVRAAHQLDDLDLADRTIVWGHSQGGHAALWTAALAADYAPELDLLGTAAISPAADPQALAERLTSSSASGLLSVAISWVLLPYSETYDDVDLGELVSLPGRPLIREMSQRCTTEPALLVSVLDGLAVSRDRPLYRGDLTGGTIGDRLVENTTYGPFHQPLLIAWGARDEVIPADLQRDYVARLCGTGAGLSWREYDGYDHTAIVQPGSTFVPLLHRWTTNLLTGTPPRTSCDP